MLIGIYTDENGTRWETYKSDNPNDVLGPFYQEKYRLGDELGTVAVIGMDSPTLRELVERVRATGQVMHHSKCFCEECRKCPKCGEMVK